MSEAVSNNGHDHAIGIRLREGGTWSAIDRVKPDRPTAKSEHQLFIGGQTADQAKSIFYALLQRYDSKLTVDEIKKVLGDIGVFEYEERGRHSVGISFRPKDGNIIGIVEPSSHSEDSYPFLISDLTEEDAKGLEEALLDCNDDLPKILELLAKRGIDESDVPYHTFGFTFFAQRIHFADITPDSYSETRNFRFILTDLTFRKMIDTKVALARLDDHEPELKELRALLDSLDITYEENIDPISMRQELLAAHRYADDVL